jgi:hypothetical protein
MENKLSFFIQPLPHNLVPTSQPWRGYQITSMDGKWKHSRLHVISLLVSIREISTKDHAHIADLLVDPLPLVRNILLR